MQKTSLIWDELLKIKNFNKHNKKIPKLITIGGYKHIVVLIWIIFYYIMWVILMFLTTKYKVYDL